VQARRNLGVLLQRPDGLLGRSQKSWAP